MIGVRIYVQLYTAYEYWAKPLLYYFVLLYRKEQNVWGSFVFHVPFSLVWYNIRIKWHSFDAKGLTQKWFLKGEGAISQLLDLWGGRSCVYLPEQEKRRWHSLTLPKKVRKKNLPTNNASYHHNHHTQTFWPPQGEGGKKHINALRRLRHLS